MADETMASDDADFKDDLSADAWVETTGPSLLARMGAELVGTFILVLIGVGAALLLQVTGNDTLTVGLAFGLAVMIAVVAFGGVSGAHLNPAVTVGAWLAGRFPARDIAPYVLAQVIGAAIAGAVLRLGVGTLDVLDGDGAKSLMSGASIGYGDHAPFAAAGVNFGLGVALGVEVLATGLLMLVILAATRKSAPAAVAPFAIGLGLAILVVWTIPFTNGALNPARATATALFAEPWALQQLWAFWVAPLVGAAIVGLLYRVYGPAEDVIAEGNGPE